MPKLDIQNLAKLESAGLINPNAGFAGLSIGVGQIRAPQLATPIQLQFIEKDHSLPQKMGNSVAGVADAIQARALAQAIAQGKIEGQAKASELHNAALTKFYGDDKIPGISGLSGEEFLQAARNWGSEYEAQIVQTAKGLDPYAAQAFIKHALGLRKNEVDRVNTQILDTQRKVNETKIKSTNDIAVRDLSSKISGRFKEVMALPADPETKNSLLGITNLWVSEEAKRRSEVSGIPFSKALNDTLYDTAKYMSASIQLEDINVFQSIAAGFAADITDDRKTEVAGFASAQLKRFMDQDKVMYDTKALEEDMALQRDKNVLTQLAMQASNAVEGEKFIEALATGGYPYSHIKFARNLIDARFNDKFDPLSVGVLEEARALNIPSGEVYNYVLQRGHKLTATQVSEYSANRSKHLSEATALYDRQLTDAIKTGQAYPRGMPEQILESIQGKVTESTSAAKLRSSWHTIAAGAKDLPELEAKFKAFMETVVPEILQNDPTVQWTEGGSRIPRAIMVFPKILRATESSAVPYKAATDALVTQFNGFESLVTTLPGGQPISYKDLLTSLANEIHNEVIANPDTVNATREALTTSFLNNYMAAIKAAYKKDGVDFSTWVDEIHLATGTLSRKAEEVYSRNRTPKDKK